MDMSVYEYLQGSNKGYGEGQSHQHDDPEAPGCIQEWLWGCCFCGAHASMSTFIESCPGCSHARCLSCHLESVKIRLSQLVPSKSTRSSLTSGVVQSNTSVLSQHGPLNISQSLVKTTLAGSPPEKHELAKVQTQATAQSDSTKSKRPRLEMGSREDRMQDRCLEGDLIKDRSDYNDSASSKNYGKHIARKQYGHEFVDSATNSNNSGFRPSIMESFEAPPKLFACHFHKFDPRKYGPWTDIKYTKCSNSHITELRHLKRHLEKAHTQESSRPSCKICCRSFRNTARLEHHYQALVPCNPAGRSSLSQEGIENGQWDEMERVLSRKGKKDVDDSSRWYEIWRILFPGVAQPTSTCIERPGYIARSSYGIDELRSEFEHRIEEDVQSGDIHRDGQLQRYLFQFQQTLEACSGALGSMRLECPVQGLDVQHTLPNPVRADHADLGEFLLIPQSDTEHPSTTLPEILQPNSQKRMIEDSGMDPTCLTIDPSLRKSLSQARYQPGDNNGAISGNLLSPFCGNDFNSEAAYCLTQSALFPVTPHLADDSCD